jgi:hypothetical protein
MPRVTAADLLEFISAYSIAVFNAAGTRGSKETEVASFVKETLEEAFWPRAEAMVVRG